MLTFPAPEAAVLAALELVELIDEPLRLRAGLHLGDAVVTRDDVLGHVVNVAARITEAAKGSEVLASVDVRAGGGADGRRAVRSGVVGSGSRAWSRCRWSGCRRPRERAVAGTSGRCWRPSRPSASGASWPVRRSTPTILDVVAADLKPPAVAIADLLEPVGDGPVRRRRGAAPAERACTSWSSMDAPPRWPRTTRRWAGPRAGGLGTSCASTAAAHQPTICRLRLAQGVQTNEVGRSAALLGGYLEVARLGLPLRVLEVGASAGLNLLFDQYRYVGPTAGVRARPTVRWSSIVPGSLDRAGPLRTARGGERRGCDVHPIDARPPRGRLRLRSFVWPDQLDRMARLDAALEVAQAAPPVVDRAVGRRRGCGPSSAIRRRARTTVVTHSIVFQYLSEPGRRGGAAPSSTRPARGRPARRRSPGCASSPAATRPSCG